MNSAIERLLSLRVSDLMSSPVTTVSECDSMGDAARILAESGITGAPVVDVAGRCVGMLSATDYAMREHRLAQGEEKLSFGHEHELTRSAEDESFRIESIAHDRVREHMSPAVQTINETASMINAARVMCREHIHRLVIIDQDERPVGLISSLDLVAAMIAVVEE
jgi:CBS-domain-containing membrane protein